MLSSRSEPRTIKRANCEPREPYLASLCSDRVQGEGSMWRSCSAHIQHDKYLISVHRLKYPLLPSGNSTLQVWRAGRDLHRLASFTRRAHVRFYSSHTPVAAERDLVRSDAQRKTIYALSTPPGKAGVAVVRISGPDALDVWQKMVKPYPATKNKSTHPEPWKMERCRITDPQTHEILDDGLAVFFKGKSFMGKYIYIILNPRLIQLRNHSQRKMSWNSIFIQVAP